MIAEDYTIEFKQAKDMDIYKFYKKEEDTKKLLESIKSKNYNYSDDVPYILKFGCIDIEMTIYKNYENEDNDYDIGYYICNKYNIDEKSEWGSVGFAVEDSAIDNDFESIEILEEKMFNNLINSAKFYNLFWSKIN